MFCRYCGKPLIDDAVFCSFCGKKLEEKQEETVVFNTSFETDPEFVWNLHEFPKPKPTEDITYSWGEPLDNPEPKQELQKPTVETATTIETVETAKKIEEEVTEENHEGGSEINTETSPKLNPETSPKPNQEISPQQNPEISLEESLFMETDQEQGQKIDKFYTFNKKNEEFQKLLDKEYEKIKKKDEPLEQILPAKSDVTTELNSPTEPSLTENPHSSSELTSSSNPHPSSALNSASNPHPSSELTSVLNSHSTEEPNLPSDQDNELDRLGEQTDSEDEETLILDNETLLKKFDTKEFEKDLIESALARSGAKVLFVTEEPDEEQPEDIKPEAVASEVISPQENGVEEQGQELEDLIGDAQEPEDGLIRMSQTKQEAFKALEALWAEQDGDNTVQENTTKKNASKNKKKDLNGTNSKQESFSKKAGEENAPASVSKGIVGKTILSIIIVLLAFEIAILGIRALAPDSAAAAMINEKLRFAVSWIDALNSTEPEVQGQDQGELQDPEDLEDSQPLETDMEPEPSPIPHEDKALLVESQLGNNENILKIEANELLVYDGQKDYKVKDINNSKPIDNNIWPDAAGQPHYYDEAVVAAVIKFNSQWIDYVNEGDQAILNTVKTNNMAEKNIKNFPKVKAMQKTFDLLQIGEIRKGENGFYVWAHEEMTDVENGKTTKQKKDWVYHLEPIGDQMLIVGYYPF